MASPGMNIPRDGSADPAHLAAGGVTWVRVVAHPDHDLTSYFGRLASYGIKVLLVLARESGGDPLGWERTYGDKVAAVQAGNEPDLDSESSWTMTKPELVAFGRRVRQAWPEHAVVCAGLASGHPEWLDGVDLSWCDAIAVHPYLKDAPNPNDIEDLVDIPDLIDRYRRFGKPILITEWGWWGVDEDRAMQETTDAAAWMATTDDVEIFFYFCWSDAMVPPFGMLKANGSPKPRYAPWVMAAPKAKFSAWPTPPQAAPSLREYARGAATRSGVDADRFERQIQQESGFDPNAHNDASGADGIAQIIVRWHPDMAGKTRDPIASLEYAAAWMGRLLAANNGSYPRALASYNWGPGNVAGWDGSRASLPAETQRYIDVVLGPGWDTTAPTVTYDRNHPAHAQDKSYDCSQDALEWAMWAWGRRPTDDWMETTMIAEGVMSPSAGLLDATGAGLAAFGRRHYAEFEFDFNNTDPVSFDDLMAEFEAPANPYPGVIGGRRWGAEGHWSGLREADRSRGVLRLANPTDGYDGIRQEMTRQQFESRGPWSLVRVMHKGGSLPPPPIDPPPSDSLIPARLREIAAQITGIADELVADDV